MKTQQDLEIERLFNECAELQAATNARFEKLAFLINARQQDMPTVTYRGGVIRAEREYAYPLDEVCDKLIRAGYDPAKVRGRSKRDTATRRVWAVVLKTVCGSSFPGIVHQWQVHGGKASTHSTYVTLYQNECLGHPDEDVVLAFKEIGLAVKFEEH